MGTAKRPAALRASGLAGLGPGVRVPTYDRSAVTPGIVHFGVGGFHRAHQAVYLDDLLERAANGGPQAQAVQGFGLCGVGLLPQDAKMRDALRSQDYLYTVITRGADRDSARVIGSIVDYLLAPEDPEAVLTRMADPKTRIVSLTITESGYCENKATGQLDQSHPTIVHDVANPQRPIGAYGFMAEALRRRRQAGVPAFTVMSCDNLLNNGAVCRRMMLAFLKLQDAELGEWVAANVAFPNSMVDRITPATTTAHKELLAREFGIDDAWPVATEPFTQWVIEDHFPTGRPAWETVGAQLVDDVEPYEKMKIRLLNGSHQVMCYIGMLLGYRHAPEAMNDQAVHKLIQVFMDQEAEPLVPEVPGIDLNVYKVTLRERFANPAINDQLGRIGTDGAARITEFVLPTVREQLAKGGPIAVGAFTVAAWIRYLNGRDDLGGELPFADAMGEPLRGRAQAGGADASAMLGIKEMFGDLAGDRRFVEAVSRDLRSLYERGARRALEELLV